MNFSGFHKKPLLDESAIRPYVNSSITLIHSWCMDLVPKCTGLLSTWHVDLQKSCLRNMVIYIHYISKIWRYSLCSWTKPQIRTTWCWLLKPLLSIQHWKMIQIHPQTIPYHWIWKWAVRRWVRDGRLACPFNINYNFIFVHEPYAVPRMNSVQ